MAKNTFKNPLTFKNETELKQFLNACDLETLKEECKYSIALSEKLEYTFLDYCAQIMTKIIAPLHNRRNNDIDKCSKTELKNIIDKTIKLGFKLKKYLRNVDSNKYTKYILTTVEYDLGDDKNELINTILLEYKNIIDNKNETPSLINCLEALLSRLVNVPLMYYHNLFNVNKMGVKEIDEYFAKAEIITVPNVIVGKKEEMQTQLNGSIWSDSYELYATTLYETIKMISKDFYKYNI